MRNIILIGFMGCGKSTLGIKLSFKMRRMLVDTDKLVEQEAGCSISEIFENEGEEAFRARETDCLKKLLQSRQERIISTGGGLPLREENRALLHKLGKVIYLRTKPETVWERLGPDNNRPLLQVPDPQAKIEEMLAERGPIYEEAADVIIDTDDRDLEELSKIIMLRSGFYSGKRKKYRSK